MSLGRKIRELRETKGMTQDDLAKAVGYKTRSSIAKIESDESDPSQKMLLKLANALEVSPADLIIEEVTNSINKSTQDIIKANGDFGMTKERASLLALLQNVPEEKIVLLSHIVQSILEDARK